MAPLVGRTQMWCQFFVPLFSDKMAMKCYFHRAIWAFIYEIIFTTKISSLNNNFFVVDWVK